VMMALVQQQNMQRKLNQSESFGSGSTWKRMLAIGSEFSIYLSNDSISNLIEEQEIHYLFRSVEKANKSLAMSCTFIGCSS